MGDSATPVSSKHDSTAFYSEYRQTLKTFKERKPTAQTPIEFLLTVMNNPKAGHGNRIKAAHELLAFSWSKPTISLDVSEAPRQTSFGWAQNPDDAMADPQSILASNQQAIEGEFTPDQEYQEH